ncbi:MAG: hypothetical protein M1815_002021 [Lichina confinis]|nr:MAG: hypothetical protein M1815_002021 [Lichina confinis]
MPPTPTATKATWPISCGPPGYTWMTAKFDAIMEAVAKTHSRVQAIGVSLGVFEIPADAVAAVPAWTTIAASVAAAAAATNTLEVQRNDLASQLAQKAAHELETELEMNNLRARLAANQTLLLDAQERLATEAERSASAERRNASAEKRATTAEREWDEARAELRRLRG